MSMPAIDIDAMTPSERVRLISELWDSLPDSELALSDAQRAEFDERLRDLDEDQAAGRPLGESWSDVRARIESRRAKK